MVIFMVVVIRSDSVVMCGVLMNSGHFMIIDGGSIAVVNTRVGVREICIEFFLSGGDSGQGSDNERSHTVKREGL